jgi:hypothetical protein
LIFDLPPTQHYYINSEHLYSTMATFGTYRLSYEPPEGSLDASIDMSISAEANLSEMLSFFETFLRAAAYPLDADHELGIERKAPDFGSTQDFWEDYNTSASSNSFSGYPDKSITSVFPGVAVGNPPARNVFF